MVEKSQIEEVFRESMVIDDEGYKQVKTFSISDLMKLGVEDLPLFLQGLLDAENNEEFNESSKDYVKGYRYGKTGSF